MNGIYVFWWCTCAGRSQFRGRGLCGCCFVGAGTEQFDVICRKPAYLAFFPSGLNQSETESVKNQQTTITSASVFAFIRRNLLDFN